MRYSKFVLAVVATVLTAIVGAQSDDQITSVEWINVAITGVGACGIFAGANIPGALYTKAILAVLSAVLVFLTSAITDGVSRGEWMQIAVVAVGALSVYIVPNSPPDPEP